MVFVLLLGEVNNKKEIQRILNSFMLILLIGMYTVALHPSFHTLDFRELASGCVWSKGFVFKRENQKFRMNFIVNISI